MVIASAAMMPAAVVTAMTRRIVYVQRVMVMNMDRVEMYVQRIVVRVSCGVGVQRIAMVAERIQVQRVAGMMPVVAFAPAAVGGSKIGGAGQLIIAGLQRIFLAGIGKQRQGCDEKQKLVH